MEFPKTLCRKIAGKLLPFGAVVLVMAVVLPGEIARETAYCGGNALSAVPDTAFAVSAAGIGELPEKRVCLTFDDGPSVNTARILDILREERIPATFFVVAGQNNEKYFPLVTREQAEGHQIALHSATHDYRKIYADTAAFWRDIEALRQTLGRFIIVENIRWLRFPGGSTNTVSHRYGGSGIMTRLKEQAEERGYRTIDWNVCAEDAAGGHPDSDRIFENVVGDVGEKTTCVVLMHDTAATGNTVKALPRIIRWFRENDFVFYTVEQAFGKVE